MKVHISQVALAVFAIRAFLAAQETDFLPSVTVAPKNYRIHTEQVAKGIDIPTDLVYIPDGSGRMLISQLKTGHIRLLDPASESSTLFLDTTNANTYQEFLEGFNSIAFHPDFANLGALGFGNFYSIEAEVPESSPVVDFEPFSNKPIFYHNVIYEYTVVDPTANTYQQGAPKREILRFARKEFGHAVNDLEFDENGLLYVAVGDGAVELGENNAQRLDSAFGKILRIDPVGGSSNNGQYGIPTDNNPF